MRKREWVWLILILCLGIFFRFWKLGETPKGFYSDEASLAYSAYSILKTGKDEFGMDYPIFFRSFSTFQAPVYTYFLIPIYKIFGMSIWSTRLLSAMAGVVIILFGFLIVKKTSKNNRLALLTSLLMAISPWLIIFSRTSYETNLSLMFLLIMIWSFYRSRENGKWLLITAISAGLSFLSYHSERIITPVILISLLINNWKVVVNKKNSKVLIISILAGLILVLPTVKLMVTPGFLSRLNSLSIFSTEVKKPWGFDENLIGWKSLIFNNQTELQLREFASLYTSYFSPRYLFGLGDPGPRSSYPDLSPLLWWQLIFFLIGVFWIFAKRNKKEKDLKFLIILILLVSPIPASVTKDPFSSIRSLPLVFPLIVLIAIGIDKCLKRFNFLGKIGLTILIIWSVGRIYIPIFKFNDYFRGRSWDEGIEEMVAKIKDENLPIVVDSTRGEIYSQILFFVPTDPKEYQKENFEVSRENYYKDLNRNKDKQIGNINVRPIKWNKDIYKEQILIGDALSIDKKQINEHCLTVRFEIKDVEGKIIFVGVKTHPKDKLKFDLENKINPGAVSNCVITTP